MGTMLDFLIATVLGGILMLNVMNANDVVAEHIATTNGDGLVQEMLITTAQSLEGEIRNMGYGVPENQSTILQADSSSITFLIRLDRTSTTIDTVQYYLGPTSDLSQTQNTMDRYLYRVANGISVSQIGVVTVFRLRYIDHGGVSISSPVPTAQLGEIKEVEITMEVQNPQALYRPRGMVNAGERDALYSTSCWQQTRLASQNLKR
jgi:hypothetical protein